MYLDYWQLQEKPFENTPDPRFFYHSPRHEEALLCLLYAVTERKGAAMLSGDYGSGKTLLSRVLIDELTNQRAGQFATALILNPVMPFKEILEELILQLGGEVASDAAKGDLLRQFKKMLSDSCDNGKHTVIIIDEAQAIENSVFEELRMLLNYQQNDRFLATLLLLGQPELRDKVRQIEQLAQRISVMYHLRVLDEAEVGDYIKHRCEVAGCLSAPFTDESVRAVYQSAGGVPRKINTVCDLALVAGMGQRAKGLTEKVIKNVAVDFVVN